MTIRPLSKFALHEKINAFCAEKDSFSMQMEFRKRSILWRAFFLLFLTSCAWQPQSDTYKQLYTHPVIDTSAHMLETDYFVIFLVNARHLDYTDGKGFFKTLAKHPSDGSKNGDVGHAWIYLKGIKDDKPFILEGGHTGEFGQIQPTYMEGILNLIECGYSQPTQTQWANPRFEPNPVNYLWEIQRDGIFQRGSGGHFPTFAAKVNLSREQFENILSFIEHYDFTKYCLTQNQCTGFVTQIAQIAGLYFEDQITLSIPQKINFENKIITLWSNPCYQSITFSTPDILEKSLKSAVCQGYAEYALNWYLKHRCCGDNESFVDKVKQFPGRVYRVLSL